MEATARPSLWSRTTPRNSTSAPCSGAPTLASTAAGSMASRVMRTSTSASGDRGDERDLVALRERCVGRRVLPVDGDGGAGRDAREAASAAAHGLHEHRGRGARRQLDVELGGAREIAVQDRKSTRLNSSHVRISY